MDACDLVILATPPGFRPQHFAAAVAAGKNIFMEKPVCVDSHGAREVLETAKKADEKNLKVGVGLQRRYQNSYREAVKKIQDGVIGDIISGQVYWNGQGIWYRPRAGDMSEMKFQVHNWYHFAWLCGDHICEQHVHNIDVANWVIGAPPVSAQGMGGRQVRDKASEIFDHHYVEFRYPNGITINSQCRQIAGTKNDVREEFHGTKGTIDLAPGHAVAQDYKGNVLWKYEGKNDIDPYQVEHNELHAAIRENKPLNNAYYGATSTFSAVLGRYATYTGQELKWDDALKMNYRTFPENPTWDTPTPTKPDAAGNYALPIPGQFKMGSGV
jgi:predicted dehydrogenase